MPIIKRLQTAYQCAYCKATFPLKVSCLGHMSGHKRKLGIRPEIIEVQAEVDVYVAEE